jgi:hypothetical protein
MKNAKSFALGFLLAAVLAFSGASFAQNATPQTENKKSESCCAMESCCCKGGSCSMKHGEKHAQREESREHSHKDGCCCCGGDSCQMKMKEKQKQG